MNFSAIHSDDETEKETSGIQYDTEGGPAPDGSDDENMAQARRDGEGLVACLCTHPCLLYFHNCAVNSLLVIVPVR